MDRQRKPALLLLLVMLGGLAFATPTTSATTDDLAMDITTTLPSTGGWYDVAHPLNLSVAFMNTGTDVLSVPNDPSCDVVLMVYNSSNDLVRDGSNDCLERSRAFDLFAGEHRVFAPLAWSMLDDDDEWLPSGVYTVQVLHTGTNLTYDVEAAVHTPVTLPSGLVMAANLHPTNDEGGPHLLTMSMTNPTNTEVNIQQVPPCVLEVMVDEVLRAGPACFAEVPSLMPGEVLLLGYQLFWPSATTSIAVSVQGDGSPVTLQLNASNQLVSPQATLALDTIRTDTQAYATGEVLSPRLMLTSTADVDQLLRFTQSCKTAMWVFDDTGTMLFDSTEGTTCTTIDLEMGFEAGNAEPFSLPQWDFTTDNGCYVGSGRLLVVASMPELGVITSQTITREHAEPNPCLDHAHIDMLVEVVRTADTQYQLNLQLLNSGNATTLRMVEPCSVSLKFLDSRQQMQHEFPTLCDDYDGRSLIVPSGQTFNFRNVTFATQEGAFTLLETGEYTLETTLYTSGRLVSQTPFNHTVPTNETTTEAAPEAELEAYVLTGQWVGLLTPEGTCWVLEDAGNMHLLSRAIGLGWWSPSSSVEGMYQVVPSSSSPACSMYEGSSVTVIGILVEQSTVEPIDDTQERSSDEEVLLAPTETIQPATVVSVVVTASMLSLLVVVVAGNESLRIPSTLAGLWFLGLIGKTHETTDGRYQRGRLMGYLTANPGCHFRALMSALNMSNGQISHHLRILENEENVWRKKDGRLVRYYPLTSQLHPNMREADLPVPPLSPDPNSLQGKILTLLDQDGGLGEFPTQAELAKRLEKSQQLVSHHLRTLEKFGLVERRKMGVKQRYKLTREAIFLLETSDDFR